MWKVRIGVQGLGALLLLFLPATAFAKITLDVQASRVAGAAPLAVQFNASATKHSNSAVQPFRQVFYEWDFGERAAGRNPGHWRHGISEALSTPLSKDEDCCSAITAHVYDVPGTYTATVTARDRFGNVATKSLSITVRDPNDVWPGSATVCVSASGSFSGCPSGARQVKTSDFAAALQSHCRVDGNTPVRCLFRRGDRFVANKETRTGAGPHHIGAFGSGADPVIDHSNNTDSSLITPTANDVRIANLRVTRTKTADHTTFVRASTGTTANHVLIYRNDADGSNQIFSSGTLTCDHGVNGYWFIVENAIGPTRYSNNGNNIMWAGRRQSFMGNHVRKAESSPGGADGHQMRIQCLQEFYIGHNTFSPGNSPGATITLRTPRHDREGGIGDLCAKDRDCVVPPDHPGCSQRNVVTGNYVNLDEYPLAGSGGFGVSSASFDGCIQDNVIERHYVKADQSGAEGEDEGTRRGFSYAGRRGTFRNMVYSFDGAARIENVVNIRTQGDNSPSMHLRDNEIYDVHVYAGTLRRPTSAESGVRMSCGPQIKEARVFNFFMYTPGYNTRVIDVDGSNCRILDKAGVCSSDSSDPTRTCTVEGNPFGSTPDPTRLDTLLVRSGSTLVDAGSLKGSLYGILGNRVTDGKPDIGAGELLSSGVVQLTPPLLLPRE
jgi:hypothetical protein